MTTLYVRGSWSEAFFWGFLPWALLAATYLVAQPKLPIIIIGIVFWVALGLCQLGLTVWAFVFLVFMQLIFHRPQSLWPIVSAGVGLGIASGLTFARLNRKAAFESTRPATAPGTGGENKPIGFQIAL